MISSLLLYLFYHFFFAFHAQFFCYTLFYYSKFLPISSSAWNILSGLTWTATEFAQLLWTITTKRIANSRVNILIIRQWWNQNILSCYDRSYEYAQLRRYGSFNLSRFLLYDEFKFPPGSRILLTGWGHARAERVVVKHAKWRFWYKA